MEVVVTHRSAMAIMMPWAATSKCNVQ
jgi:hypothetical protein